MPDKILIVEDEANISEIIKFNLEKEGFQVVCAYDGEEGYEMALSENPDLILLDIMMPKKDGLETCKDLRKKIDTPIIMLTAKAEEIDKVLGLELGADDYVTKPFGNKELIARIKANLRRKAPAVKNTETPETELLRYGAITIDRDKYEVFRNNIPIPLTRREYDLVLFLATQNNQVFSRETLLEKVWGYEYLGDLRTVDVTVRRLRTKLEIDSENPVHILTKRGIGYYFGF